MNQIDLKKMQKKGQASVNSKISFLIGALIVVVLATAIAPEMFGNIAGFDPVYNETTGACIENCSTPEWVPAVLYVIVGAGLVFLIWRAFGNNS